MVSRECQGLNTPVSAAQSPWLTSVRLCRSGYCSSANIFESFVAGVYLERGDRRGHFWQWERNKVYKSKQCTR